MPPKNITNNLKNAYNSMSVEQATEQIRIDVEMRRTIVAGLKLDYENASGGKRSALTRRMNTVTGEINTLTRILEGYGSTLAAGSVAVPPLPDSIAGQSEAVIQSEAVAVVEESAKGSELAAPFGIVPGAPNVPLPPAVAGVSTPPGLTVPPNANPTVIPVPPGLTNPPVPPTVKVDATKAGVAPIPNTPDPLGPALPAFTPVPPVGELLVTPPGLPNPPGFAPPAHTPIPPGFAPSAHTPVPPGFAPPAHTPVPPVGKVFVTPPGLPSPSGFTAPAALPSEDPAGVRPYPRPKPIVHTKNAVRGSSRAMPLLVDEDVEPAMPFLVDEDVKPAMPLLVDEDVKPAMPFLVDEDVKPVIVSGMIINANIDMTEDMTLLTSVQAAAILQATEEVALGILPGKKRKSAKAHADGPKMKRGVRKAIEIEIADGGGSSTERSGGPVKKRDASHNSGKVKDTAKGKGRATEEDLSEDEDDDEDAHDGDDLGDEVTERGRKRAAKQQRTGWITVTISLLKDPEQDVEEILVRIPAPFGEQNATRIKLNRKGWRELHNYITCGMNPSCIVLVRSKRFRWYCTEIGAISRLLVLSAFILRNKRTRCHFHSGTDRGSSHNDIVPKINKATGEAFHIVTGVPLSPDDTTLGSNAALAKWHGFKGVSFLGEIPGSRDPDNIPTTIGGMTEDDLLSFFYLHTNGCRYLGCGCELESAIFDFFLWKTAPHLFSETTGSVECLGNPWEVRFRPTLVNLCSGMGFGPEKLDTMFKYNRNGERNDLSLAPLFVRDFWAATDAQKAAEWPRKHASPPPKRSRTKAKDTDRKDTKEGQPVVDLTHETNEVRGRSAGNQKPPKTVSKAKPVTGAKDTCDIEISDSDEEVAEEDAPFDSGGEEDEFMVVDELELEDEEEVLDDGRHSSPLSDAP